VLIAAEAVGLGRAALALAVKYAGERHRVRSADRQNQADSSIRSRSAGWSSRLRT